MRPEREVRDLLDKLCDKELSAMKGERLSKKGRNCVEWDSDHKECNCSEDEVMDCSNYVCRNTPEIVEERFEELLRNPSYCGEKMPKVAMLLWVLKGSRHDAPKASLSKRIGRAFKAFDRALRGEDV